LLCASCHPDTEEQLASQATHAPADEPEGCANCHGAHATPHASLLLESVTDTCLTCHDGSSTEFAESHLGMPATEIACADCHDPHASQMAGLLLPQVHMPFADGDCELCHLTPEDSEGGDR